MMKGERSVPDSAILLKKSGYSVRELNELAGRHRAFMFIIW